MKASPSKRLEWAVGCLSTRSLQQNIQGLPVIRYFNFKIARQVRIESHKWHHMQFAIFEFNNHLKNIEKRRQSLTQKVHNFLWSWRKGNTYSNLCTGFCPFYGVNIYKPSSLSPAHNRTGLAWCYVTWWGLALCRHGSVTNPHWQWSHESEIIRNYAWCNAALQLSCTHKQTLDWNQLHSYHRMFISRGVPVV